MNRACELGLGCLLLALALAFGGGCGDDADVVFSDASAVTGDGDGSAEPNDDDEGEPGGDGDGDSGDGDGDGDGTDGDDPPASDAGATDGEGAVDGGGSSEPTDAGDEGTGGDDAATASDAAVTPATDCESLEPCCNLLRGAPRMACLAALEAADDEACAELGLRACMIADGGRPTPEMCDEVAPCCAELEEGRRKTACEAAAAAPVGRACERAVEMYCQEQ